jgi:eukaryotic-like serine/threonine-protein kinase
MEPDTFAAPAAGLGGRYVLDREIGRGGMATVYLARDTRENREVAVKVMHPRLAGAIDGRRFLREIEIAASLSHPRIVPLYDSGQAGSVLYYVMPYIEGGSLHQRLERERRLPLEPALTIAADVAAALGYAHSRGILHRDVKPENVLLRDGRAVVVDFGLARAIGEANYRKLTQTGILVGTAFYMSSEQIREDRDLDARSDIYSLGCILYEMLAGEPPYAAPSIIQLIRRIVQAPIPLVRVLRPDVPPEIEAAIARAMAKAAADRFPTMEAFAAALQPASPAPATLDQTLLPSAETPSGLRNLLRTLRSAVSRGERP